MKKVSQEEAERQLQLSLMGSALPRTAGDEAGSAGLERGLNLPPGYLRNYGLQPEPKSEPELVGHELAHTLQLTDLDKRRRSEP